MKSLSANLVELSESLVRANISAQVTVEHFLPAWTVKVSGSSPGQCHGHAAAVAPDGAGAGEDILFRARSGSTGAPTDGKLYIAVIKLDDLDDSTAWDGLWIDSGVTGLMHPYWGADSGAAHGGAMAAAWDGASHFRVFATLANGSLNYYDFDFDGALAGSGTVVALGTTSYSLASMQIAACSVTEVFVLRTEEVEPGYASWHKPIYGSKVKRYYFSGTWQLDPNSFLFHTHAEGHLLKDNADYNAASAAIQGQWGMRPCGGLAVNEIDANTVAVSWGQTFWKRWGPTMNNQGLATYLYYRDSGTWRRGDEAGIADYLLDLRLHFDTFARGSAIAGRQFVAWSQASEPTDIVQVNGAEVIPRPKEVVVARFSEDGKHLTQFLNLGSQTELTAAALVVVNHAGTKLLYALGWRGVQESPAAAWLCEVPTAEQISMAQVAPGVQADWDNRWSMGLSLPLSNAAERYVAGTRLKPGNLMRFLFGLPDEQIQLAQGYIDLITPQLSLKQKAHRGKAVARADKYLLDTSAETIQDILPQNVLRIEPTKPVKNVARHAGRWTLAPASWPDFFFPGDYPGLSGALFYELQSTPPAFTGGGPVDLPPGVYGGGGKVWDAKPADARGHWFRDVVWLAQQATIDGSIQATVRMGDNINHPDFGGTAADGCPVTADIVRVDGQIERIDWGTPGCHSQPGGVWNQVYQHATMAGLICEAVDIGRKYSFFWETDSALSTSTHQEDQAGRFWNALVFDAPDYDDYAVGANKLYFMLSDFDTTNPDWQDPADRVNDLNWQNNQGWIHKVVAGGLTATGLTPGRPADLKMTIMGGTAYCFYRAYPTGANPRNPWRFAFSYNMGRFGAGRKGIVARGDSGIHWDVLWPLRNDIKQCDNFVGFRDIYLTDGVEDKPMEEILRGYAWQGYTKTRFRSIVDEASRGVNAGATYMYPDQVENICIDFDLTIAASGGEAGLILKANANVAPTSYIQLGLAVHSTYSDGTTRVVNCQAVKRRFSASAEVVGARDYSPSPFPLLPGVPYPCRVTVRGPLYSIWVGGNLVGSFFDETQLSWYFGLYATGQNATFAAIHLPELYETPEFALLDVGQAMRDAMSKVIGRRRIKGVFQSDGALLLSYFKSHDQGPTLRDALVQNTSQEADRFKSAVKVEGAYTSATYVSPELALRGRRFDLINQPDLMFREHCLREAMAEVRSIAERMDLNTFIAPIDLRLEPEDEIGLTIAAQNKTDSRHYIESLSYNFKLGSEPQSLMQGATRRRFDLE